MISETETSQQYARVTMDDKREDRETCCITINKNYYYTLIYNYPPTQRKILRRAWAEISQAKKYAKNL